jgi:hypothetical protein
MLLMHCLRRRRSFAVTANQITTRTYASTQKKEFELVLPKDDDFYQNVLNQREKWNKETYHTMNTPDNKRPTVAFHQYLVDHNDEIEQLYLTNDKYKEHFEKFGTKLKHRGKLKVMSDVWNNVLSDEVKQQYKDKYFQQMEVYKAKNEVRRYKSNVHRRVSKILKKKNARVIDEVVDQVIKHNVRLPKLPGRKFAIFFRRHVAEVAQKFPLLDAPQLSKYMAVAYQNISPEEKRSLELELLDLLTVYYEEKKILLEFVNKITKDVEQKLGFI